MTVGRSFACFSYITDENRAFYLLRIYNLGDWCKIWPELLRWWYKHETWHNNTSAYTDHFYC